MHHYINTELGPRDDPHLWVLSLSFRLLVNSIRVSRRWPSSFLFWVAHKALTPIARGHNGSRICFWSPQTLNCSPYCERLRFSLIRDNTIFPILWMLKWIRWCCRLVLKELKEREREREHGTGVSLVAQIPKQIIFIRLILFAHEFLKMRCHLYVYCFKNECSLLAIRIRVVIVWISKATTIDRRQWFERSKSKSCVVLWFVVGFYVMLLFCLCFCVYVVCLLLGPHYSFILP